MLNTKADIRYVRALYALGAQANINDKICHDLILAKEVFKKEAKLASLLTNPSIPRSTKRNILKKVFENEVDPLSLKFLDTLLIRNRIGDMAFIAQLFIEYRNKQLHISRVHVQTAVPLQEEEKNSILDTLSKLSIQKDSSGIDLSTDVNPDLIGGFTIAVDGYYIDASIKGRLNAIEKSLNKTVYQKH